MARIEVYDPIAEAAFHNLFRGVLGTARAGQRAAQRTQSFRLDLTEDASAYTVSAELPGVAKNDIQVTIDADQVTIAAEARRPEPAEGQRTLHAERRTGSLLRSFRLPVEIDEAASEAKVENGVLTLRLAKKVAQAGRTLTIQ